MRIVRNKKRTAAQVERILTALKAQPMTIAQLAESVHLVYGPVAAYIRKLKKERLVYISDYKRSNPGRAASIYSVGNKPDLPFVRTSRIKGPIEARRKKEILVTLKAPLCMKALADKIGISQRQCAAYVRALRADKKVFISHWTRSIGPLIAHYRAGQGIDAPAPGRLSDAEYKARDRSRKVGWATFLSAQPAPERPDHKFAHLPGSPIRILTSAN